MRSWYCRDGGVRERGKRGCCFVDLCEYRETDELSDDSEEHGKGDEAHRDNAHKPQQDEPVSARCQANVGLKVHIWQRGVGQRRSLVSRRSEYGFFIIGTYL
jgi:hypothetical protein